MATQPLPSQEVLRQLLRYEPETGKLFWKQRDASSFTVPGSKGTEWKAAWWNSMHAGKEAFQKIRPDGYRRSKVEGQSHYAHRIIWKLHYGVDPAHVDHINGDRTDNRIKNLRSIAPADNNKNMGKSRRNRSGIVGVSQIPCGRWSACIVVGSRFIWLGSHATKEEAVHARLEGERLHGFLPSHRRGSL